MRHEEMHRAAGIDLTQEPLAGLGSVCKRVSSAEIAAIITTLAAKGIRLHCFGVKRAGLARIRARDRIGRQPRVVGDRSLVRHSAARLHPSRAVQQLSPLRPPVVAGHR